MFNGNFGLPEALFIAIILIMVAVIVAGLWLTKKSKQSPTTDISRPSGILIALGLVIVWFGVTAVWRSPLFSSYTLGGVFVLVLVATILAYCGYRFGKRTKDWNAFARWFYWTIFVETFLLMAGNK